MFSSDGTWLKSFGSNTKAHYTNAEIEAYHDKFDVPMALAFNKEGNLLVTDSNLDRLKMFDPTNFELKMEINNEEKSNNQTIDSPCGVTVDNDNNIIISDPGNNRIQVFNSEGVWQRSIGKAGHGEGEFFNPIGVAVDPQGNLFVVDNSNNRVVVFDPIGNPLRIIQSSKGKMLEPWGISIDRDGKLLVADQWYA